MNSCTLKTLQSNFTFQVQIVGSPVPPQTGDNSMASEEMALTPINAQQSKNSIMTITNDAASIGSNRGRPPDHSRSGTASSTIVSPVGDGAPSIGGTSQTAAPAANSAQNGSKSNSSRPCCFCWCCCCSCSW